MAFAVEAIACVMAAGLGDGGRSGDEGGVEFDVVIVVVLGGTRIKRRRSLLVMH
jgi:ribose/xylose/arabinose/galactoside ABC-type transport system permease subunit